MSPPHSYQLRRPLHDLPEQLRSDIGCLAFDNLLNPALLRELLVVLSMPENIDQLLGGNEVVKRNDLVGL